MQHHPSRAAVLTRGWQSVQTSVGAAPLTTTTTRAHLAIPNEHILQQLSQYTLLEVHKVAVAGAQIGDYAPQREDGLVQVGALFDL